MDGLLEALGGDGGTLEDQAVNQALCEAFAHLYPDDAETYEDLEAVTLDEEGRRRIPRVFRRPNGRMPGCCRPSPRSSPISRILRWREARDNELRERIQLLVTLGLGDRSPLSVDWRGDEGREVLDRVVEQLYEDMEDLEP